MFVAGSAENISGGGVRAEFNRLLLPNSVLRCEFFATGEDVGIPTLVEVRWSTQLPGKRAFHSGLRFLF